MRFASCSNRWGEGFTSPLFTASVIGSAVASPIQAHALRSLPLLFALHPGSNPGWLRAPPQTFRR
eukprot:6957534-Heterocapsa_arctica.AAC.1